MIRPQTAWGKKLRRGRKKLGGKKKAASRLDINVKKKGKSSIDQGSPQEGGRRPKKETTKKRGGRKTDGSFPRSSGRRQKWGAYPKAEKKGSCHSAWRLVGTPDGGGCADRGAKRQARASRGTQEGASRKRKISPEGELDGKEGKKSGCLRRTL